MNQEERARQLFEQLDEYHLKDFRWQQNFKRRMNRIARTIDPTSEDSPTIVVMFFDHISLRTGLNITWGES